MAGAVHLAPGAWRRLDGAPGRPAAGNLLAVCGIGRPDAFAKAVAREGTGAVELFSFPDHHPFTSADVARMAARAAGRSIVVTEKDAVKLEPLLGALASVPVHVMSDRFVWDWGEQVVRQRITAMVAEPRPT
ncbi:MAG: tetraacyldisaccharide 4'-kinase [Longimicrobiales bacterium]